MKNTIGSTQQALTIVALNSLPILLPPLSQQKEIADILSSLDNKIELLREENKTLEAIAQTIFKEWFVNFNFPDENGKPYKSSGGKMIDSKLGEIPEGWRIGKICEILELNYGKALREEDRIAGSYPVFGSSGIIGTNKEYLINGPGIIVGRKGSIGTIFWSNESFYPIDTTFYVKDKIGFQDLYFHYFLLKKQDFENRGSDSAVPGLNRNSVYSIHIVMPDKEIIQRFSAFVKEIFNKKMYVCIQIQTLSDLHCLLLPRLIKGETRIIGY